MNIYLVGGAVRDQLLELPVTERDWVVVGATEQQMLDKGFRPADAEFPVFLHPETGEEYALARTEVKTGPGYKGFQVDAGPHITLLQDLLRRDLTVNALAMDETGNLIDLCGGREDLDNGLLRHITPAFSEDPVRLLRVARFAAKLGQWGFRVAHGTHGLMKKMAASPDLENLKPERVWCEMLRAMAETQPWRFFEVLHSCGALARLIPSLDRTLGLTASHASGGPSLVVEGLKRATTLTDDVVVRTAVALIEAATYQPDLKRWLRSLRAGRGEGQLLEDLMHLRDLIAQTEDVSALLHFVGRLKPKQQPDRFRRLLVAADALWPEEMVRLAPGLTLAAELVSVKPPDSFYRAGLQGQALGKALHDWRLSQLQRRLAAAVGESADEGGS